MVPPALITSRLVYPDIGEVEITHVEVLAGRGVSMS
jgi:hypothetical protein